MNDGALMAMVRVMLVGCMSSNLSDTADANSRLVDELREMQPKSLMKV